MRLIFKFFFSYNGPLEFAVVSLIIISFASLSVIDLDVLASEQNYSVSSLFIGIFSNGDALIQYDIKPNSNIDELSLKLIGENITNLSVKNYSSHDLPYYVNLITNELTIKPHDSLQIRITYMTPTIVDKKERTWTFSANTNSSFNLKLPTDAAVIDMGHHPPKIIRRLGEQELLSFDPGKVSIKYILGFVGTKDQAQAIIDSAENDIKSYETNRPGIYMNSALDMLEQAKTALDRGDYVNAEGLANNSSSYASKIASDFDLAKKTIDVTANKIKESQLRKITTVEAQILLTESNKQFAEGKYANAIDFARSAQQSMLEGQKGNPETIRIFEILLGLVIGIILILLYLIKIHPKILINRRLKSNPLKGNNTDSRIIPSSHPTFQDRIKSENMDLDTNDTGFIYTGTKDNFHDFRKYVQGIINSNPELKDEDKQALLFLAEKEGSAFEGELRTKFLLPKTSVWRLVKRLERLDLIEVTKMGGQNLLKLKLT